jgi:uncharacterized protein
MPIRSPVPNLLALLALAAMVLTSAAADAQTGQGTPQPRLRTTPFAVTTATGPHSFTVEMALTPEQMSRGLMFRRDMAPDEGMLFDFGRDQVITMWMENTILSLDMIFLSADGRVLHIAERTTPFSRDIVSSTVPARAVLEVIAGTARRIGLRVGDRARNVIFGNAP